MSEGAFSHVAAHIESMLYLRAQLFKTNDVVN